MDEELLKSISDVSTELVKAKEELNRYDTEDYLNNEKRHPWITVSIGNHPTCLRDFNVRISDKSLRDDVVELALRQLKKRIKKLEAELKKLIKQTK